MTKIKIFNQEGEFDVLSENSEVIWYKRQVGSICRSLSKSDKGHTWDYIPEILSIPEPPKPDFDPAMEEVLKDIQEQTVESFGFPEEALESSALEDLEEKDGPDYTGLGIEEIKEQEDEEDRHESD